jgi:sn-glycerol 3-phosphate transport system substrate-binding protein
VLAAACSDPPTSGSGSAPPAGGASGAGGSLPDCPVDALGDAEGPVEIELWYGGLGGETQKTMEDIVAEFNRSQDEVVVRASDQGAAYQEVDRAFESAASAGGDQLPDIVYLEDIQLASVVDSGLVLPAQACMEAAGYDPTQLEPAARSEYTVGGVLYPGYMNVSTPILYYTRPTSGGPGSTRRSRRRRWRRSTRPPRRSRPTASRPSRSRSRPTGGGWSRG